MLMRIPFAGAKRVRVYISNTVNNSGVRKKRNGCCVRNKQQNQKPFCEKMFLFFHSGGKDREKRRKKVLSEVAFYIYDK